MSKYNHLSNDDPNSKPLQLGKHLSPFDIQKKLSNSRALKKLKERENERREVLSGRAFKKGGKFFYRTKEGKEELKRLRLEASKKHEFSEKAEEEILKSQEYDNLPKKVKIRKSK